MEMNRAAVSFLVVLGLAWVVAHMLYLGPVEAATETAVTWVAGLVAGSAAVAGLTVLFWGAVQRPSSPAWLRFLAQARTTAAALGLVLVVVGLLHWRDTEPRNELHWVVLGCAVLAGAIVVHGWLVLAGRRIAR
jgi:hypothetical protein